MWLSFFPCRLRLHLRVVLQQRRLSGCERERDHDIEAVRHARLDAEGRLRRQEDRGRLRTGEIEASKSSS